MPGLDNDHAPAKASYSQVHLVSHYIGCFSCGGGIPLIFPRGRISLPLFQCCTLLYCWLSRQQYQWVCYNCPSIQDLYRLDPASNPQLSMPAPSPWPIKDEADQVTTYTIGKLHTDGIVYHVFLLCSWLGGLDIQDRLSMALVPVRICLLSALLR